MSTTINLSSSVYKDDNVPDADVLFVIETTHNNEPFKTCFVAMSKTQFTAMMDSLFDNPHFTIHDFSIYKKVG